MIIDRIYKFLFLNGVKVYNYYTSYNKYSNDILVVLNKKEINITRKNIAIYLLYYWFYSILYNLQIDICFYCRETNNRIITKRIYEHNRLERILSGSILEIKSRYNDFYRMIKEEDKKIELFGINIKKKERLNKTILFMYVKVNDKIYDIYLDQEYFFYIKGNIILDKDFIRWYMIHYHNKYINDYELEYMNENQIIIKIKECGICI